MYNIKFKKILKKCGTTLFPPGRFFEIYPIDFVSFQSIAIKKLYFYCQTQEGAYCLNPCKKNQSMQKIAKIILLLLCCFGNIYPDRCRNSPGGECDKRL